MRAGRRWARYLVIALAPLAVIAPGGCTSGGIRVPDPAPKSAGSAPSPPPELADRAVHTATVLTDEVALVAGGCVVDGCSVASDAAFLVTAAGAARTAPLTQARDSHTATQLVDGRVLVVGGFRAEGQPPLSTSEVFDPGHPGWSLTGSLVTARGGHAAARLGDSSVLVAGGWVGTRSYTRTTEIFVAATSTFHAGPPLPVAVDGLAAATLDDGSVLITGGQSAPGVASTQAVLISPAGSATKVGPLHQARFKHAAVSLRDGRVLIIGGTPDDTRLLTSTELYDPASRTFTPGPELATGRYKLAGGVAVTPAGQVVVAGGGRGVEVLDVAANTSRRLEAVPPVRLSFSTVFVLGRTLRVLGGYDEDIRLTGTDLTVPVS